MLKDDIYSADDDIAADEGLGSAFTNKLIQSNLGIHFSSDEDEAGGKEMEELPCVSDALDRTVKVQETAQKIKQSKNKGKSTNQDVVKPKGRKKTAGTQFSTEKLIRETGAPLPVTVTKPKTFASLTKRSEKSNSGDKIALLKRRLTPEQFELLKKSPRLTADESISASDNLIVVNAGHTRRLGRREGSVGIPVPRTKPASIDILNKHLDAKIVTQGRVYERLQQVRTNKWKKAVLEKVATPSHTDTKFVAPFGYDRAKSLHRQYEEKKRAEKDVTEKETDEAELNPLLYPEEEPLERKDALLQDQTNKQSVTHSPLQLSVKSVEESWSEEQPSESEESVQSRHVNFVGSVTQSPKSPKPGHPHHKLASLFVDDEAESGDSDEEHGNKTQHGPAEYYDEEQYRKDVEDFLTDDESVESGNMQDIHRQIAMDDDKRAIHALINKFGVVDNETAAWMQRMHDTNKAHDDTQEPVAVESKPMSAENESKIKYLTRLGFTRTRTIQPATNEFLFPEETKTGSSRLPTSEPDGDDLGSFNFEPTESSSDEEMDCQIPSDSDMLVEEPVFGALDDAPEIQDLGVVELCNRKDAFGMLGRKNKARSQLTQPSNLIVSSKKIVQ